MTVRKYRSVAAMPRLEPSRTESLASRIRVLWTRARLLAPPLRVARGVTRFRTIEEANAARTAATVQRMRESANGG